MRCSAPDLRIIAGGTPSATQTAALASALADLMAAESAAAPDPVPASYRSRWRRAAIREGVHDDAGGRTAPSLPHPPHPRPG